MRASCPPVCFTQLLTDFNVPRIIVVELQRKRTRIRVESIELELEVTARIFIRIGIPRNCPLQHVGHHSGDTPFDSIKGTIEDSEVRGRTGMPKGGIDPKGQLCILGASCRPCSTAGLGSACSQHPPRTRERRQNPVIQSRKDRVFKRDAKGEICRYGTVEVGPVAEIEGVEDVDDAEGRGVEYADGVAGVDDFDGVAGVNDVGKGAGRDG